MNKVVILGLIMLIIGITLFNIFDNDVIDFLFGFLVVGGTLLTITGTFNSKSKLWFQNKKLKKH